MSKNLDVSDSLNSQPLSPRPYPPRGDDQSPLRGLRLLLLSTLPGAARALAQQLTHTGCTTRVVGEPDELAAAAQSGPWDVVCLQSWVCTEAQLDCIRWGSRCPALITIGERSGHPHRGDGWKIERHVPAEADGHLLLRELGSVLEQGSLITENEQLRASLSGRYSFGNLISRDIAMRNTLSAAESVADTRASVLLTGESGTGKTLLARTIHLHSARSHGPFVVVNCAALPPGLLESELFGHVQGAFTGAVRDKLGHFQLASGGTLFLDEINSASLDLQVKLLRAIQERLVLPVGGEQERPVDVRLISASNRDLRAAMDAREFREDLYYRINVVGVHIPALRERPADLKALVEQSLERLTREYQKPIRGLSPACLSCLAAHPWPGNVRQLENVLERAVLLAGGERLEIADLGEEFLATSNYTEDETRASLTQGLDQLSQLPALRKALEAPERAIILRALELCQGNRKAAADMLEINRSTLFNKMRKYGLMSTAFG